jgi:PAS domain S-box-containing protein
VINGDYVMSEPLTENQNQSELLNIKRVYQHILDSAGEGIYGLDKNGCATFANAASTQILGWCSEDIIGSAIHEIHHHTHENGTPYPREDCPIYNSLQDGQIHRVDCEIFWKNDGTSIPVEYISTPIIENDVITGAVIVFRDISQRRKLERDQKDAFTEISRLKEELELERDYLRNEINITTNMGEIIGESSALQRTLSQLEAVADTPTSVLVLGESGVGKELIARAIHCQSGRSESPLVKVNCASIPKDLFESEFFGHIKGAFTGAHRDRVGRLQLANGGTLFLDEVGEIPLDLQGKLLRALQEHEFERVGDEKTTKVDVRIVAATNRDLAEEVKLGNFREDLYYRLSVFPISVPPLRDRTKDIGPLAQHFLNLSCEDLRRGPMNISKAQVETMEKHDWPGNIRELKNVIERAVILSKTNKLRLDLAMPDSLLVTPSSEEIITESDAEYLTEIQFKELEKNNLVRALNFAKWKIAGEDGAANLLGLKPSTLTYRMQQFGIKQ